MSDQTIDRSKLPIRRPAFSGVADETLGGSQPDWGLIGHAKPPDGAPNVLVVLIDDAGFGNPSTFGGPIDTPNYDRMAAQGLRYNRFHVTAMCSPTRAALLTGRNHHAVGMGGIPEFSGAFPGYSAMLPRDAAPFPKVLKENGYSTAGIGKWHLTPEKEQGPAGPFNHWPNAWGFDYYWGFLAPEAGQYDTMISENQKIIGVQEGKDGKPFYFPEAMTDQAIDWLRGVRGHEGEKPWCLYYSTGCSHAPHQVWKEWSDKYKGKFDQGWDKLREETFARQKKLGVIPADCQLTPRHKEIPAWDEMPEALKPVLRREMEVYAGYMEYTDYHVGRILDGLKKLDILDDTLVYYIIGDNGASAEGGLNGCYNEMSYFNGLQALETPEYLTARLDKLGGPESYNHYAVGWAHAMNTPYQWTKQVASHWGGTRNGTIVHWPKGIKGKGEIRLQFHHVIDVAPTILEAAGLPEPASVNGIQQDPIEGVSMLYSFNDAKAAEQHETQYFEMFGNRGIYHKGWTAVTKHRTPWASFEAKIPAFDDDVWELYDTATDWSQAKDLSKQLPEKLHALQRLWLIEATRYKVLPLDDRMVEKMNPDTAGRPVLIKGKTQILFGGMGRLLENCVLNLKNKSHSVTAEIVVPEKGAEGVIISQGANIGGWSLYANNGKLKYCYNWGGFKHFFIEGATPIPAGEHQVRMEFAYAGGGLGKGGKVTLYTDGNKVGEGEIGATLAMVFSADDGCDVGEDSGAPVSPDYGPQGNAFNGRVKGVQLAIAEAAENLDHLISPEVAVHLALARQ